MKRFWLVLLSLGLIVAFSTQAMAVDVKFSGEFYAAGMYVDKGDVVKNTTWTNTSSAFYYQRLRLNTTFVVHPGLYLITRADIMERAWGAARTNAYVATSATDPSPLLDTLSAGTAAENENIAWDLAYITYISPIGIFLAGYQIDNVWGTVFGDNSVPTGKIGYMFRGGPITAGIQTGKNVENSLTAKNFNQNAVDRDSSFYTIYGIFGWKGGQAGILGKYIRNAVSRNAIGAFTPFPLPWYETGAKADVFVVLPYVKAQLGPVALQAELIYLYGKTTWEGRTFDIPAPLGGPKTDVDMRQLAVWVDAVGDFGKFYVGGTAAYVSGDDPGTADKAEGGTLTGGLDWNPALLLFNNDMTYWQGGQWGAGGVATTTAGPFVNGYFLQVRAGVRPVEKLDIMASLSWAHAEHNALAFDQSRDYGYEVDLTATYKITNNLSYMLGGAYLFTGDWFKYGQAGAELTNNFLVINKLTLTF